MITKIFAPFLLTGAAAAAIALAPIASAGSTASCDNAGPASLCSRNGHAAIFATPPRDVQQFAIIPGNPFGSGPVPPMLAMD